MGRVEGVVGSDGYAVGGKMSLADVMIFNMFADNLSEGETLGELPGHRRECFGSKTRTDAALAAHPKLKAIVDQVAANENVKKWMATRGKQGF